MEVFLGQCGLVLCRILAQTATGLALFVACTLLLAKTKQQFACFEDTRFLAVLTFSFAPAGCVALWLELWLLLTQLQMAGQNVTWPSLFAPAVLASTASACLWLCSAFLGLLLWLYQSKMSKPESSLIAFAFVVVCSFFLAMTFQFYSFDRPPEGISRLQVFVLALQAAFHLFFRSLSPAGIVALLTLLLKKQSLQISVRWCALWAVVGSVPYLLNKWGTFLGYFLRGDFPAKMFPELFASVLLSLAIMCFALLFLKQLAEYKNKLIVGGSVLYVCAELSLPLLSFVHTLNKT